MNSSYVKRYGNLIVEYAKAKYRQCLREPSGYLSDKYIVPGSVYSDSLWDWDSWLTNIALRRIASADEISEYEKGCILNFLKNTDDDGVMPICIVPGKREFFSDEPISNIHKPCIAQHALFVAENNGNDASWIRDYYPAIERFIGWYELNCKHESGLFVWINDSAIGVDNDPCTFYRPKKSSASIFLNCLLYKELLAVSRLAEMLGLDDRKSVYAQKALELKQKVQEHCWDERDGSFYSVDCMLLPVDENQALHSGCPRHWNTLLQRIDVWSNFLPMWAGIATPKQAERMVKEHYRNKRTFNAPYGVRTLSKLEKMYAIIKSGNPSCWLGPIWGISNYLVFDGLIKYGYKKDARELAKKTVMLFGKDIEKCGEMHEYYHPETGGGVNNPGFQNWNLLAINMFDWLNGK